MAENSKIEWCTHTFNPWWGCTKVSAGCANCYADTLSKRNPGTLGVWGPNGTRVVAAEGMWREPLKWDRAAKAAGERHRVFCASLADVFEDWLGPVADAQGRTLYRDADGWHSEGPPSGRLTMTDVRIRLFDLIQDTPHLDWLLLTKRPENVIGLSRTAFRPAVEGLLPRNVWLGTSVENQKAADERIPHLLKCPAAVRFLSCEPLIGPVEFSNVTRRSDAVRQLGRTALDGIHWVIVGGESGGGSRPMHPGWVRSIRDQCQDAGVAFFFKQWGEFGPDQIGDVRFTPVPSGVPMDEPIAMFRVGKKAAGRLLDGVEWSGSPEVPS